MIIRTELIKETCNKILPAVDDTALGVVTEMLALEAVGSSLYLRVTNKAYLAEVKLDLGEEVAPMKATVQAKLFLKLLSSITGDTVEFKTSETALHIKWATGSYKLGLNFEDDRLMELPKIEINNVANTMTVDGDILVSLITYNLKETQKSTAQREIQKYFYVDEQGCVTFSSGACVNSFSLPVPVKVLFDAKLVKLFKLFKGKQVNFTIGYDAISEKITQTKVKFEADDICITAILNCDDSKLSSVPVNAIRGRANAIHKHSVAIYKDALAEAINRLLLFATEGSKDVSKFYAHFEFTNDFVTLYDYNKRNNEVVYYSNEVTTLADGYSALLDINDLKCIVDTCSEQYVTLNFGDNQAMVIPRATIKNVVPEVHTN